MARHYLDHASTTPIRPEAREAIAQWEATGVTADPGRVHTEGRLVRAAVERAREQVAELAGIRPRQVVFTSGGTEAINAAAWGVTRADPGPVLCSRVEHSAVRDATTRSAPVVELGVDHLGRIDLDGFETALKECNDDFGRPPSLVHCQFGNHEVGTLQPVYEIVARCRSERIASHVDAVAAVGHLAVDLDELGADLVSISSHKLGGPPGIGALLVRRGLRLEPLVVGGDQERARRAGMENVPAIIGFGAAAGALLAEEVLPAEESIARDQTERLTRAALSVSGVTQFGDPAARLPHIVCLGVEGVEAEPVLLGLDQAGIAVHSGSSCSSESLEPSPVLEAMGADAERSLRLSVGWSTTDDDVAAFAAAFPPVVEALRALRI
ncbi:MAG: aminotransferase class V-fold PLP-dependent enzyme [Acidimicrobiales bacterium]